jgi:hypothetical protein
MAFRAKAADGCVGGGLVEDRTSHLVRGLSLSPLRWALCRLLVILLASSQILTSCGGARVSEVSDYRKVIVVMRMSGVSGDGSEETQFSRFWVVNAGSGEAIEIPFINGEKVIHALPVGSYRIAQIGMAKCKGLGFEIFTSDESITLGMIETSFEMTDLGHSAKFFARPVLIPPVATPQQTGVARQPWIAPDAGCTAYFDYAGTKIAKGVLGVISLALLLGLSALGTAGGGNLSGPMFY